MTAATFDIRIVKGKTFEFRLRMKDASGYIDLTGCEFKVQCRPSEDSSVVLFEGMSTGEDAVITLDDQTTDRGRLMWKLTPNQTKDLPEIVSGVYEIEITYGDGDVDTAIKGRVTIEAEIVR